MKANELAQNFKHTNQMIEHILAKHGAAGLQRFETFTNKPVSLLLHRGSAASKREDQLRSGLSSSTKSSFRARLRNNIIEKNKKNLHATKQKRDQLSKQLEADHTYR